MNWIYILYFAAIVITTALMGFMTGYARGRRHVVAGAGAYMWISGMVSLLAVCEGLSILSPSPAWALFFFNVRFLPFAVIPVIWLVFALRYTGKAHALSKRTLMALCVVPVLTQIMMWTNGLHGLWVKQNVGFHRVGRFFIAETAARIPGPWYHLHQLYTYAVMLTGVVIIFIGAARMFRQYRGQAAALVLGTLVMIGGSLLPVLNLVPGMRVNPLILFFALGSCIIAWAVFRGRFLGETPKIDPGRRLPLLLLTLFMTAAVAIVIGGYAYYRQYMIHFRDEAARRLSAVAELKADELVRWRRERQGDAEVLYQNDAFTSLTQRLFSNPADETDLWRLETWLGKIQSAYAYSQIVLLDAQGAPRLAIPRTTEPVDACVSQRLAEIRGTGNVAFLDFYRAAPDKPVRLAVVVPVRYDRPEAEVLGFVVLAIDPAAHLYPQLSRWPMQGDTAEILLVRRDGEDALVLNELRSQKNTALRLRTPLTDKESPGVMAVLGKEGLVEGSNRRGTPVAAALRAVPDSPWFIVAGMDMAEMYAPLRARLWFLIALLAVLLVWAASGAAFVWLRQQERFLQKRLADAGALRESEEKYRLLTETIRDIILFHDMEGRILYVNQAGLDFAGFTREEGVGRSLLDFLPGDQGAGLSSRREKRLRGDLGEFLYEIEFINRSGRRIPVEINSTPMLRDGKVIGVLILARDITARKQTERELLRLKLAIEQTGDEIVITDPNGIIQYVNPAFERVTGYGRLEAVGQNPRILKSGRQEEAFYRDLWTTITSGATWNGRMVNKRKDGTFYTEEATISPVRDAAGGVVNYVAVKRDITEHLRLSAQLIQAQKMESVGRLAGGVAHDFNNMLGVILGYTELALQEMSADDPLRESLEEILGAARRSEEITRQLLAFARKQTINPEIIDLNQAVKGMLKMLRRLIGEDIDLAWQPGPGLWPVNMDSAQVDQILANLLVNARDAIAGVGGITIETGNVSLDDAFCADHAGLVPGDYVLLAVRDDGRGMDRETLGKLFEPFFTTKGVGEGTGLGLATVYGIVKQNNGFVYADSQPQQGTTFRIYLPRHAGEADRERIPEVTKALSGRGETVLIVEDEASVLKLVRRILRKQGYAVLTAAAPVPALKLAGEHQGRIDLLITDVIMPEMNGRELAERMRAIHSGLKVLYMSGYAADIIGHRGVLETGVHFVQKPFSNQDLTAKVREALGE